MALEWKEHQIDMSLEPDCPDDCQLHSSCAKCDCDAGWNLVVEEGSANIVCRECNAGHPSFFDYPEDIWVDPIPVTVEINTYRDYWAGDYDYEVIIEVDNDSREG